MLGRIVRSADFERALATPSLARSPHFAVHHLGSRLVPELSTGAAPEVPRPVDDLPNAAALGLVVPKRFARRAVTRALVKREIRSAARQRAGELARGLWVIRLRAPFDPKTYSSAGSIALRHAVRQELDSLLKMALDRSPQRRLGA